MQSLCAFRSFGFLFFISVLSRGSGPCCPHWPTAMVMRIVMTRKPENAQVDLHMQNASPRSILIAKGFLSCYTKPIPPPPPSSENRRTRREAPRTSSSPPCPPFPHAVLDRQCRSAQRVAEFLDAHPCVAEVGDPALGRFAPFKFQADGISCVRGFGIRRE